MLAQNKEKTLEAKLKELSDGKVKLCEEVKPRVYISKMGYEEKISWQ